MKATDLYLSQVCLSPKAIAELEESTRDQAVNQAWHVARRLRITASSLREVCHRRPGTACDAFVTRKLIGGFQGSAATRYGVENEPKAIASYDNCKQRRGYVIDIQSCGLLVDPCAPWLAASPDALVSDSSLDDDEKRGCLE